MTLKNIITATKRAKHFASHYDGPYCAFDSPSPANYCWLLDGGKDMASQVIDKVALKPRYDRRRDKIMNQIAIEDIVILDQWAASINRMCDSIKVKGDAVAENGLACFLSRIGEYYDPIGLIEDRQMPCILCNQDHKPDVPCSMTRIQEFKRSKQEHQMHTRDPYHPEIEISPIVVEQNSKNKFDRSAFMKEKHKNNREAAWK